MAKAETITLNFDDISVKRQLQSHVGTLKGLWDVTLKQRRRTRSLDANAYYWAAYVPFWHEWLKEATGEPWITKEQAHKILVKRILGTTEIINKETGEVIDEIIPETHTMDSEEFAQYLDRAAEFMASFCGIAVAPSESFYGVNK
jgi:hypothetical protein